MTHLLRIEDLEDFCECGNRNEWIAFGEQVLLSKDRQYAHYWGCTACRADESPPLNKFDQLVDDLLTSKLNLRQVGTAVRTWIGRRKDLPEGIKSFLYTPGGPDLIGAMFTHMGNMIGSLELAYRRGEINRTDA